MDVIRITLRSDLCAGNGESRGNAVDIDIVLTADGLPRIPARRLNGCLRAAAEELAALGDETAAYTAELFGDKAGRQGCLWVGDAALPQEAAFTAWLKQNPAWADHSRVEQLYTDVRGQTRLQDGRLSATRADAMQFADEVAARRGLDPAWVRATIGFIKRDGQWLIAHEHASAPLRLDTMQGVMDRPDPA